MTDALDPASLVEAAQKAASDGDFVAAERLLRDAALKQEASLGSVHPDLAITLNNLAFVCERTNKFDEAERGYRRAHKIAVASLPPRHPFIATSLGNLLDFCATRGIPVWVPPAARSDQERPPSDPDDELLDDFPPEAPEVETATDDRHVPGPVASRLTPRTITVAAVGIAIVVAIVFMRQGQGTKDTLRPLQQSQPQSSPNATPAIQETAPVLPREPQPPPPREPQRVVTREQRPDTATASVTVLNARVCSAIEKTGSPDWQCTPVNGEVQPGTYIFYTRLLANADTTVEHRWYRGDRVHQVRRLRVTASAGSGYRTFSSNTVSPERAGDWKVELRAADGSLLHAEHFLVR